MVLTTHNEVDGLTATFLMADREESLYDDLPIYSPCSPLGTALCRATGERALLRGGVSPV